MMKIMNDRELLSQGFMMLVKAFGDVNAERFITLTIREPQDYTRWREQHMYIGESVRETAARARAATKRLEESMVAHNLFQSTTEMKGNEES